ncbi:MAG TPA: ABC transporter ATP-binding protein [Sandaracinaceae bacterium LLY-WYZ-13_1]|nr:ABC transporter ATP-binding protein [Sandaracinaceae bacterium LLY-WYZ-13_1]
MSERVIEVRGLRKQFGGFVAVRDVSFHVEKGEIFGYLGANGAGKSTTIRMLCGLLPPTAGRATVAGHDVTDAPHRVKSSIGYMSQKFSLYLDLTAAHNLEFFGGIYGLRGKALRRATDAVVERTGLDEHRGATTGALPGGIRQRLALACALIHEPRIVFLDEPTAGVDPASRRDFWRLIRELARDGTTVFVTTHYMDEAEYCARIGLMVDGALVALDTPDALKARFVPGESLAVEGRALHLGTDAVRALPRVLAAEPFGARLHVRFEDGHTDREAMERCLRAAGARVDRVEPVEASLEDVFLAVVGGAAEEAA